MQQKKREKFMIQDYYFYKGKRGAIMSSKGKTEITIYIDDDILAKLKEQA